MTFPLTNRDDALADLISNTWVKKIREFDAVAVTDFDALQQEIAWARGLMDAAGWPRAFQHDFLMRLRNRLTELTDGHPVTRQFLQALTLETEFN